MSKSTVNGCAEITWCSAKSPLTETGSAMLAKAMNVRRSVRLSRGGLMFVTVPNLPRAIRSCYPLSQTPFDMRSPSLATSRLMRVTTFSRTISPVTSYAKFPFFSCAARMASWTNLRASCYSAAHEAVTEQVDFQENNVVGGAFKKLQTPRPRTNIPTIITAIPT